ncbi:MAG: NifB/NifX family molybdenum-iron cluster-binding protein [Thiobacillaceae bacterium]|jgi:nitrogen fixation protein NifX
MRHLKLVHSTEAAPIMSVKIAFASSDRKQVDQHFGAAEAFAIYELSEDDARLIEVAEFTDSDTAMDGHEGKLASKIALLDGCAAVYCNAVGASAIKQLLAAGIQPMKVPEGMVIDELLCGLNQSLTTDPPTWLEKNLKPKDSRRFADIDAEGWQE